MFPRRLQEEIGPMVRLAWPVVLSEIGWMAMGLVDTMMVGRVSAAALGGVGIGSITFITIGIFGLGLLLGLDTLVSHSFGAGNLADCHRWLRDGVYLSLMLTAPLMGLAWAMIPFLHWFRIQPDVLREAIPYLEAVLWSTLPLLLYSAFRRYLQAMNLVQPVMFALLTANLVNAAVNWVLIFGHLGAPAMGAVGAGWATTLSRLYMALFLLGYILYDDRRRRGGLRGVSPALEPARLRRLLGLGLPAALQLLLEVGVFAAAAALIAKLGVDPLAAHHIAMTAITAVFMVPLGISSAGAVRVGQALGRGDPAGASRAGWTALLLTAGVMFFAVLGFWLAPRLILRLFTPDAGVIATGVSLLGVAGFFQLFDGAQVVATGNLRGAGETRIPMYVHLGGHWLIGLPLGYLLGFPLGLGAVGLWVGLCVGLILIGTVLLIAWRRKVQSLARWEACAEARPLAGG